MVITDARGQATIAQDHQPEGVHRLLFVVSTERTLQPTKKSKVSFVKIQRNSGACGTHAKVYFEVECVAV